jgi:probable phosphomutase (TIGR03848 family)
MTVVLIVRHGLTASTGKALTGWLPGISLDDRGRAQAAAVAARLAQVPLAAVVSSPLDRCAQTASIIAAGFGSPGGPATGGGAAEPPSSGGAAEPPTSGGAAEPPSSGGVAGPPTSGSGARAAAESAGSNGQVTGRTDPITVQLDERLGECRYGDWTGQSLRKLARDPLWRVVQAHPSAVRFPGPGGETMTGMQQRAVEAVRDWNARLGPDAVYLVCSHGDVIKAILADALGMHLDMSQRIQVDPCSLSVVRYTPLRPFVLAMNDTSADATALAGLARRPAARPAAQADAQVGGGAGASR